MIERARVSADSRPRAAAAASTQSSASRAICTQAVRMVAASARARSYCSRVPTPTRPPVWFASSCMRASSSRASASARGSRRSSLARSASSSAISFCSETAVPWPPTTPRARTAARRTVQSGCLSTSAWRVRCTARRWLAPMASAACSMPASRTSSTGVATERRSTASLTSTCSSSTSRWVRSTTSSREVSWARRSSSPRSTRRLFSSSRSSRRASATAWSRAASAPTWAARTSPRPFAFPASSAAATRARASSSSSATGAARGLGGAEAATASRGAASAASRGRSGARAMRAPYRRGRRLRGASPWPWTGPRGRLPGGMLRPGCEWSGDRSLRCPRALAGGGKSGLHGSGWLVTPTGREPRESATENRPPTSPRRAARVKRCGKSAPHSW